MKSLNTSNFAEQKDMTKDDLVIQLGDLGLWWDFVDTKEENYWRKWIMKKNFQFCFLDGNHENFDRLEQDFTDIEYLGGKAKEYKTKFGSIIWLQRGEVYTYKGKTLFVMGGAQSTDKEYRTVGTSWWEQEVPNYYEMNKGIDNLAEHKFDINYVLTHTFPSSVIYPMFGLHELRAEDPTAKYFESLIQNTEFIFDEWNGGHMHVNTCHSQDGRNYRCHYKGKPYKLM
jgi:hypothetical protein